MSTPPATAAPRAVVPLCVDLDGTLIRTDMVWESLVRALRRNPFYLLAILAWWCRGRAYLKQQLARRIEVPVAALPYTESFLAYLRGERAAGRALYLVTASDLAPAQRVADYVGLFDGVLASDGRTNLRGDTKGRKLAERFGQGGFVYAGNSAVDLAVWPYGREAVIVNGSAALLRRAAAITKVGPTFDCQRAWLPALIQVLRPHQWLKSLIILVPLLTAHRLADLACLQPALWTMAAFALGASAVYVLNDLLDLDHDRAHPSRRERSVCGRRAALPVGLGLARCCSRWRLFWQRRHRFRWSGCYRTQDWPWSIRGGSNRSFCSTCLCWRDFTFSDWWRVTRPRAFLIRRGCSCLRCSFFSASPSSNGFANYKGCASVSNSTRRAVGIGPTIWNWWPRLASAAAGWRRWCSRSTSTARTCGCFMRPTYAAALSAVAFLGDRVVDCPPRRCLMIPWCSPSKTG